MKLNKVIEIYGVDKFFKESDNYIRIRQWIRIEQRNYYCSTPKSIN